MDVVDQIQQGDVIRRVRIWDGETNRKLDVGAAAMTKGPEASSAVISGVHEKGANGAPFFDGRGQLSVSCRPSSSRPWLSLPLSVIPPFMWVCIARALTSSPVAAAWHAHSMPALLASGTGERRLTRSQRFVGRPHKGWPEFDHPHTRCRLWTRNVECQAQSATKSQKTLASSGTRFLRARTARRCRSARSAIPGGSIGCMAIDDLQLFDRLIELIHCGEFEWPEPQARTDLGASTLSRRAVPARARAVRAMPRRSPRDRGGRCPASRRSAAGRADCSGSARRALRAARARRRLVLVPEVEQCS